jgi:hypothetical protein
MRREEGGIVDAGCLTVGGGVNRRRKDGGKLDYAG